MSTKNDSKKSSDSTDDFWEALQALVEHGAPVQLDEEGDQPEPSKPASSKE